MGPRKERHLRRNGRLLPKRMILRRWQQLHQLKRKQDEQKWQGKLLQYCRWSLPGRNVRWLLRRPPRPKRQEEEKQQPLPLRKRRRRRRRRPRLRRRRLPCLPHRPKRNEE